MKKSYSMKTQPYRKIICPYCTTKIHIQKLHQYNHSKWGILSCDCDCYPIINDIVYLKKNPLQSNRVAVNHIKNKRYHQALLACLRESGYIHSVFVYICWLIHQHWSHGTTLNNVLTFLALFSSKRSWFDYLKNRHDWHDLNNGINRLQTRLKRKEVITTIVDIGSGIGHSSQALLDSNQIDFSNSQMQIISLEKEFESTLLHQMYFQNKKNIIICCDVESGIPVAKKSAQLITVFATISMIHNKISVITEMQRVLNRSGSIYISNVLKPDSPYGYGISLKTLKSFLLKSGFQKTTAFSAKNVSHDKAADSYDVFALSTE